MSIAYVDSSVVVALSFGEPHAAGVLRRFSRIERVYASSLLEAEVRSACRREGRDVMEAFLLDFDWVKPARSLGAEIAQVLEAGYVRGADCWHLACALYLQKESDKLVFLTLDIRQKQVARALGFPT